MLTPKFANSVTAGLRHALARGAGAWTLDDWRYIPLGEKTTRQWCVKRNREPAHELLARVCVRKDSVMVESLLQVR